MKIVKIVYILPYNWGGMPHYTAEIANAVSEYVNVTVIGSVGMPSSYFSSNVDTIKLFDELGFTMAHIRKAISLQTFRGLLSFRKIKSLTEMNPDVIHLTTPMLPPLVFFILLYRLDKKYPVIYTKHCVYSNAGFLTKIFEEYILGTCERLIDFKKIVVHTQKDKDDLLASGKLGSIDNSKIVVVPHGTYSFFNNSEGGNTLENNCLLFFGSIKDYKGLEYLIKAVPLIAKWIPDIKVIIAGEGDLSSYQPLIEACDKSMFEIYNEFVPDDLVASLFQRSTLAVLPYTEMSGMSGVLNVAYAFGKPVVVSDVGGLDEEVEDGKTGLLVPPRDPQALANAIIRLLKDPDLRAEMERNVKIKASELSWDNIAKKTMEIYQTVLRYH